ncbi:MAG: hypothetical protein ACWA5T_04945 [Parvularcula sp.]
MDKDVKQGEKVGGPRPRNNRTGNKMKPNILSHGTVILLAMLAACSTSPIPQTDDLDADGDRLAAEQPVPLVAQKMSMASGDKATINDVMEKLIGEWHQSPENFGERAQEWMKENNVSGFYDTFSWGPNKAWINFGDFQIKDEKPVQTGIGMISWHPGFQHLRFRESGGRGGFVDGMIEIVDDNTFVRHYQFYNPDGEMSYYSDNWIFDPEMPNCFIWQSIGYKNGVAEPGQKRKFCRQ